jgi:hypothetical protein
LKERNKQEQQNTKDTNDKYNMDGMASKFKTPTMPKISMPKF